MITKETLIALKKKNPTKFLEVLPLYVAEVGLKNLREHNERLQIFDNKILDKMMAEYDNKIKCIVNSSLKTSNLLIGSATYLLGKEIKKLIKK